MWKFVEEQSEIGRKLELATYYKPSDENISVASHDKTEENGPQRLHLVDDHAATRKRLKHPILRCQLK